MIPLVQLEIQNAGWLDAKRVCRYSLDCTDNTGPIIVNAATYIGFRTARFLVRFVQH